MFDCCLCLSLQTCQYTQMPPPPYSFSSSWFIYWGHPPLTFLNYGTQSFHHYKGKLYVPCFPLGWRYLMVDTRGSKRSPELNFCYFVALLVLLCFILKVGTSLWFLRDLLSLPLLMSSTTRSSNIFLYASSRSKLVFTNIRSLIRFPCGKILLIHLNTSPIHLHYEYCNLEC